ncbi:glycosyltransferase [Morganella morganii]|nr:glycosyltransferase [Morganella morganii]EKW3940661.1 glycosyltransferase [Morganella morganii]
MKILLVITGLGMGGAEKQVCALANNLSKNHSVAIISLSGDNIINKPDISIPIYSLDMKKNPLSLFKSFLKIKKIINDFKPDIVHSHMFHANIFTRISSIFSKMPVLISTAHNSNEGGTLRMLLYRYTDRFASLSTNVSQEGVDVFIKKKASSKNRMILMHNGIDTDKFKFDASTGNKKRDELNISNSEKFNIILSIGRLTKAKDYPNLLTAFSHIDDKNTHLVIIGEGDDKKALQQLASDLKISKNVHFLGLQNDISAWMSAADLYVMSSAWEGMPLVIGEAMSCQSCIVATDCGGIIELMNEHGFIVPKMEPYLLAEKINYALSLPIDSRRKIGLEARQHIINNFSLTTISQQWLDLYNKLSK